MFFYFFFRAFILSPVRCLKKSIGQVRVIIVHEIAKVKKFKKFKVDNKYINVLFREIFILLLIFDKFSVLLITNVSSLVVKSNNSRSTSKSKPCRSVT